MPKNWKTYKLTEIGTIARGKSKHRPRDAAHLYGGEYPFIQTGDVKATNHKLYNHSQTYSEEGLAQSKLWPKDTMCITIAANIAETSILTYPACFPDSIIGFIANEEKCNVDFIEFMMQYFKQEVQSHSIGSVQDNINLGTFDRLEFLIPPLPEQKAIAQILSAIDNKIENNLAINKTLEDMAMTLYKHWFVDFDFPITKESHPELVSGSQPIGYKTADGEIIDSELGPIPKGWEVKKFGDIVIKYIDNRGKTPPIAKEGIPLIEVKHISSNLFPSLKVQKYVTKEIYDTWFRSYLEKDDIVISTVGTVGLTSLVPKNVQVAIAQNLLGIRFDNSILPRSFMFYLMKSRYFLNQIENRLVITVQKSIKRKDLNMIPCLIPASIEIKKFEFEISGYLKSIENNLNENQTLTKLRDTLLPKLISGEVRIKEFREQVENVL